MTELSGFKVRVFAVALFLCAWKAGVWSASQCETSLGVNGIYEATGVALWLQTGAFSSRPELPIEDVNWQSLLRFHGGILFKECFVQDKCDTLHWKRGERQKNEGGTVQTDLALCHGIAKLTV